MDKNQEIQSRLSRAWTEVMGRSQKKRIQGEWGKIKGKKEVAQEDKKLAAVLLEHKEYYEIWEKISPPDKKTTKEVNPYLHAYLHLAIENQVMDENPRQVGRNISSWTSQGTDRHIAVHEITTAFSEYLIDALRYGKPFDKPKYIQRLNEMSGK